MSRKFQPREGFVVQAYQFALDPTPEQADALRSHCGAARFAFNWGLAHVQANIGQRDAERSHDIPTDELMPALNWSAYSLRKDWNAAKDAVAPWWAENGKEAYSSGLANLADALGNWKASKTGNRAGPAMRFPRFKSKRGTWSYTITTGAFGLAQHDRRHVKLPRIGLVRTHESTRKLARRIEAGTDRILKATVSYRRGRWFVSLQAEVARDTPQPATTGGTVGVDLGVTDLAVLATGETIPNPKHLEHAQRELRRLQRQAARRTGPDKRTRQQPSNRWRQTQDRIRRLHSYVANARADGLHKLSTRLVSEFDTVVVEDLHVAGMVKNRKLARHVAGVGMGELRRQVDYKTTWNGGGELVTANRFYPSSKTCSACGVVKAKLRLRDRVFHCENEACGLVIGRDYNAACNLADLAREVDPSTESCAGTQNKTAGNPRKTSLAGGGYRHGKADNSETVKAA